MNQQHNPNKNTHPAPMPSATVPPVRMGDADKENGNMKVVIAFLLGVVIGGAGMWFASGSNDTDIVEDTDGEILLDNTEDLTSGVILSDSDAEVTQNAVPPVVGISGGDASISVKDQSASDTVKLDSVTFGAGGGWAVVHEMEGEFLGRALGARRFDAGTVAGEVPLLRNTVSGNLYQVVLYADNGDKEFSMQNDTPFIVDGHMVGASFNTTGGGVDGGLMKDEDAA
jgi:hypothetical protein